MKIHRVDSIRELQELEPAWQRLFETGQHAHLANSFAYVLASAATLHCDRDWRVYLARDGNSLQAAAFGMRSSISIGKFEVPTYGIGTEFAADLLVDEVRQDEVIVSLITTILDTESVPIVELGRLTEPAFQAVKRCLDRHGIKSAWHHHGYGYAWDATIGRDRMYEQLSSNRRYLVRRGSRRMNRSFKMELRRLSSPDVAENLSCFDNFVELEASGWKGREGTAMRVRAGHGAYYRMIVEAASSSGMMRWFTLLADDRIIAMLMGMQARNVLWVPKIAYDEQFARYSPGLELVHQFNLDCIDNPEVEWINWIGAAEWLDTWRPTRQPFYHLRIFSRSLLGRSLHEASRLQRVLRRYVIARGEEEADQEQRFL